MTSGIRLRALAISVLGWMACGGCSHHDGTARSTVASAKMEQASALANGHGVPRDYEAAARIYDELCDGGRGLRAACDALVDAIHGARGVAFDPDRAQAVLATECGDGDKVACFLDRPDDALLEEVTRACDQGDPRACGVERVRWGGDGSHAEHERARLGGLACKGGDLAACSDLIIELSLCGEPDVADEAGCEQHQLAGSDAVTRDAVQRLRTACDAGDALACDPLPGRAIASDVLCKAHDYGACAALACMGDDAAAAAARAHHARANCYVAVKRTMKAWMKLRAADPAHAPPPPIPADPMAPIGARQTPPFGAVLFRAHGGRDAKGWPRLDANDISDRDVAELSVCAYAYDDDDHQLARVRVVPKLANPIPSNGSRSIELASAGAPAIPPSATRVLIDYDHVRFAGDANATDDAIRCPDARALLESDHVIEPPWR